MLVRRPTVSDLKGTSSTTTPDWLSALTALVCVASGTLLPTQAGINVRLAMYLGHPLRAALVSFCFGTMSLAVVNAFNPRWKPAVSASTNDSILRKMKTKPMPIGDAISGGNAEIAMTEAKPKEKVQISESKTVVQCETDTTTESQMQNDVSACVSLSDARVGSEWPVAYTTNAFPNDELSLFEGVANLCRVVASDWRKEWFVVLGGALGVYFVSMAIYLTPCVGPSIFFISMLLGQMTTSIALDKWGFLWNTPRKLTLTNYSGIAILFAGVLVFNLNSFGGSKVRLWVFVCYVLLSVSAGVTVVLQASLNKRMRFHLGSPFRAALVSFSVGASVLAVASVLTLATNPGAKVHSAEHRWFAWFGGCLGAVVVTVMVVCPSIIGFSASFTCAVAGNLALSLTYDALGAFGFPKEKLSAARLFAVLMVLVAAILVNWTPKMTASLTAVFCPTTEPQTEETEDSAEIR